VTATSLGSTPLRWAEIDIAALATNADVRRR
jgi:hypothetical protein